ncbi:alpha/beta hydrolase [bacterium]|nr:MAG: alpha/beta hydrolase [bacterium]
MKIYCYSGLGADRRAFRYLDLTPHELVHIDWIDHLKNETLEQYAVRMMSVISVDEPFALMGLSFGGMIAVEVSKHIKPEKLIVISSIVCKDEMPAKYKLVKVLGLHKMIPVWFFKHPTRLTNYFFGAKTERAKKLLTNILQSTDYAFLKWAIGSMLNWKNTQKPNCVRIHGTDDHILPIDNLPTHHRIQGGGHFMIVQKADQLSEIITQAIAQ